jgi:uncharacterized protein (TIGR00251 family)
VADLRVRLTPRAHRDEVTDVRDGLVHARVRAPPVDGRANAALEKLLAKALGVPPSHVQVVRGQSAREKVVRVDGVAAADALAALGACKHPFPARTSHELNASSRRRSRSRLAKGPPTGPERDAS